MKSIFPFSMVLVLVHLCKTEAVCRHDLYATFSTQTITSPEFPNNYPNNLNCTWMIWGNLGNKIQIEFTHINLEPNHDYIKIGFNATHSVEISGTEITRPLLFDSFLVNFMFISDDSTSGSGFRALYFLYSGDTSAPNTTRSSIQSIAQPEDTCQFVETASFTERYITSPRWPNNYPNNLNCSWTIWGIPGHGIKINFTQMSLELKHDYVKIFDNETYATSLSGSNRITFISTTWIVTLKLISDETLSYSGFRASVMLTPLETTTIPTTTTTTTTTSSYAPTQSVQTQDLCHFYERALSSRQYITSPNWPDNYPNNLTCRWTIRGSPGNRIELRFSHLNTELFNDYVEIYDNETKVLHVNGRTIPELFVSSSWKVTIKFITDESITKSGFRLGYALTAPAAIDVITTESVTTEVAMITTETHTLLGDTTTFSTQVMTTPAAGNASTAVPTGSIPLPNTTSSSSIPSTISLLSSTSAVLSSSPPTSNASTATELSSVTGQYQSTREGSISSRTTSSVACILLCILFCLISLNQ